MPEDLLDETQIGAVLQHQRRHGVTQKVRASTFAQVRGLNVIVHHAAEMIAAERIAVLREEQRHVIGLDHQLRPDFAEIFFDPLDGPVTDRHVAVFLPLALADEHGAVAQVGIIEVENGSE